MKHIPPEMLTAFKQIEDHATTSDHQEASELGLAAKKKAAGWTLPLPMGTHSRTRVRHTQKHPGTCRRKQVDVHRWFWGFFLEFWSSPKTGGNSVSQMVPYPEIVVQMRVPWLELGGTGSEKKIRKKP